MGDSGKCGHKAIRVFLEGRPNIKKTSAFPAFSILNTTPIQIAVRFARARFFSCIYKGPGITSVPDKYFVTIRRDMHPVE